MRVEVLTYVDDEDDTMESEGDIVGSGIVPRKTGETGNDYPENDDVVNVDDDIENTKNPSGTVPQTILFCHRPIYQ